MNMPADESELNRCKDQQLKDYSSYDQTVDIVSCWQSLLTYSYENELVYFDRYPEMTENDLKPDFTALFGHEYGLVGEVKRTFPNDAVAFKKEIDQLVGYGSYTSFKSSLAGDRVTPTKHDVVLVLFSPSAVYEIAKRISELIQKEGSADKCNLVILEGLNLTAEEIPRYVFRKIPTYNRAFRDDFLPYEKRFETCLGLNCKSFEVYPKHFLEYKIREVLCNDTPPPLYMAVFLWTKVLYDRLRDDQVDIWRRGSPQQIIDVEVSADDLVEEINNQRLPSKGARRAWIINGLEFLCEAGYARRIDNDIYAVRYRNLSRMQEADIGEDHKPDERAWIREYCERFAVDFCSRRGKQSRDTPLPRRVRHTQQKLEVAEK
jgi:hypothetical protein